MPGDGEKKLYTESDEGAEITETGMIAQHAAPLQALELIQVGDFFV